jgi:hypothetical protein
MHGSKSSKPVIWLIGDVEHRDFADAVSLLKSTASIGSGEPELIVVAQSHPGTFRERELNRLRRSAPLAGVVSLLGSWCEGETRTGRPLSNALRLYWYEFSSWWQRQLHLRSTGSCPKWAGEIQHQQPARDGLLGTNVGISAATFDTVAAIGDAIHSAKGRFAWWRENQPMDCGRSVDAGVWIGGQLNDAEASRLASFCAQLAQQDAPVVALFDFPRQDRLQAALEAGAASVLGMPWRNDDLTDELRRALSHAKSPHATLATRAA